MATVRELKATFQAKIDGFKSSVKAVNDDLDNAKKKGQEFGDKLTKSMKNTGDSMKKVGGNMSKYVTVPLAALGAGAFAAANDMDKAYNNIRVGTGAVGDDLESLKDDFKAVFNDVPTDADTASNAIAGLNTMTGATGETLQGLTAAVLEASRMLGEDGVDNANAFGSALTQWGIPAEEGEITLDKLFKATQDYGIGLNDLVGQLNKFGPTMQGAGFTIDESADLFGRLNKAGIDTSKVMPGLTKAFSDWTGEGKDARVELDNLIGRFRDGTASSEDFSNVTEMFGDRAGNNFIAAVKSGMIPSIDELGDALQDTEGLVRSTGDETQTFGDRMVKLKNRVVTALEPIGKVLLDMSEKYMPKVEKAIERLSNWFGSLSEQNRKWLVILGLVAAALGPVLVVVGTFLNAIAGFIPILTKLLPLFKYVRIAIAALTGPIGIVIAIVTTLAIVIYKNWDDIKAWTIKAFNAVGDFLKKFWNGCNKLFNDTISWIVDFAVKSWNWLSNTTTTIFKAISSFFSSILSTITTLFKTVIKTIVDFVKDRFNWAKTTITTIFTAVFNFYKTIWSNIWNTFKTVIKTIVDYVKNRFEWAKSTISTIFTAIFNFYKSIWSNIWNTFKTVIKTIVDYVKNRFDWAKNTISTIFNAIFAFFKAIWKSIQDYLTKTIANIVSNIYTKFTNAKNTIKTIFDAVFNTLKRIWDNIYNTVRNAVTKTRDWIRDGFNAAKNRVSDIMGDMWKKVKDTFNDIVDAAKGLPKRIGDGIKSMAGKVSDGLKSVSDKMIDGLAVGVNGVIKGVNWVLDKLGVDSNLPEWKPNKGGGGSKTQSRPASGGNRAINAYKDGTDGHPGGPAIVGDGGMQELISYPNGRFALSPDTDTLVNLPRGTGVLSGPETKSFMDNIPLYKDGVFSKGLKMLKGAGQAVGKGVGALKDKAKDVWDWAAGGAKSMMDKVLKTMGVVAPNMAGGFGKVAKGAFGFAKDKVIDYVSGLLPSFGGGGGVNFPSPFRMTSKFNPRRKHPITGVVQPHNGVDFAAASGTPIPSQSGGKVTYAGWMRGYGNVVFVKSGSQEHRYAHNSKNSVKVGDSVKPGQTVGLVGSTGDSTGPHVHYELRVGGKPVDPMGGGGGFAGTSGASGQVKTWIQQAINATGVPNSWLESLATIAQKESGGNPRAVNNWDINAKRGTPSKGLMQTIEPTFNAYKQKGMGAIFNPVHNTAAAINYIKSRYGNVFNVPGIKAMAQGLPYKGYADGGIVDMAQLAWIAEGGWAESIISHDPNKRARSRAIWQETGDNLGFSKEAASMPHIEVVIEGMPFMVDGKSLGNLMFKHVDTKTGMKTNQNAFMKGVRR